MEISQKWFPNLNDQRFYIIYLNNIYLTITFQSLVSYIVTLVSNQWILTTTTTTKNATSARIKRYNASLLLATTATSNFSNKLPDSLYYPWPFSYKAYEPFMSKNGTRLPTNRRWPSIFREVKYTKTSQLSGPYPLWIKVATQQLNLFAWEARYAPCFPCWNDSKSDPPLHVVTNVPEPFQSLYFQQKGEFLLVRVHF